MRSLKAKEMDLVAGGSTPSLVCSVSGDARHSDQICQTSSGLTIITTKDTVDVGGGIGITGKLRDLLGLEANGHWTETTTQVKVCTSDGKCTDSPPVVTKQKVSDESDGSSVEGFADANAAFDQLGDNLGGLESFAGDGFSGDFGDGFGGGGGFVIDTGTLEHLA